MNNGSKQLASSGFDVPGVVDDFRSAIWFGSDVGHALAVTARGIISRAFGERGERIWNSQAPQDLLAVQAAFGRAAMNLAHDGMLKPADDIPRNVSRQIPEQTSQDWETSLRGMKNTSRNGISSSKR